VTETTNEQETHFCYIAECADGTFYTGYTTDINNRAKVHNEGKGARYTRSRLPVRIIYSEEYVSRSDAMKREAAIKRMSRNAKAALISNGDRKNK
jgi:putative endonuclease